MIFAVTSVKEIIFILVVTIISLSVHEFAHAFTAHLCGDDTAYSYGRMTLNPIKHLDPFGFLAMLFMGFGWARPVPVNMRGLKNPRRDMALVSLAGPLSNFILAFFGVAIIRLLFLVETENEFVFNLTYNFYLFFAYFSILNVGLGLFNLIPIPPLDGSKILSSLLPPKWGYKFMMLERYTPIFMVVLFALSYFDAFNTLFYPIVWLRSRILHLFTLPFFFGESVPF
ncbi:MAG: site-2 protease family protein [Clostridia bacterium]|nr:site-2 protease family protein [Clostridia bacterium]